jgi:multiple sugar transport system permease protein
VKTSSTRQLGIRARDDRRWFWILTSPWLVGFILLSVLPLVFGFIISLTNYNGVSPDLARFIGFSNYERAFNDPNVLTAATRTAVFVASYVPLNFVIALGLALLMNASPRARGFFRALYYLPSVIPVVAAAVIWRTLFNKDNGIINNVLVQIDSNLPVAWFQDFATPTLVSLSLWLGIGLGTVLFTAALQNVPEELEQASRIDGADYLQRLRHIIFPIISPVIFFQVLMSLIFALGVVIEPILLGTSSPQALPTIPNDNLLLTVYTYQQMFSAQRFGYASALLWITFVGSVLLTSLVFMTRRFWVHSESGNI